MNAERGHLARRLPVLAFAMTAAAAVLGARIVWLGAVADARAYAGTPVEEIRAPRGTMWDRDGALVAAEVYAYEVGAAPPAVADPVAFADAVAPLVGTPAAELRPKLSNPEVRWALLSRAVDAAAAQKLQALDLDGLFLTPVPRRSYPLGAAAGHITGFLNMDGQANYGLEATYNDILKGTPGRLAGALGTEPQGFEAPRPGVDLVLSIDRELQVAAYTILAEAVAQETASGGTVVILAPATGSILAMASLPTFDPGRYYDAPPESFADNSISLLYEPGSVVKAMTMAIGLDAGAVSTESTYADTGTTVYGGVAISNFDRSIVGTVSMLQLLQHSLNVGAVHVADLTGPAAFYRGMRAFGFGSRTGIDLAGEVDGILRTPQDADWHQADLATNSFGQGLAATPLQVATAMAAIANNGVVMVPRLVEARLLPDGRREDLAPRVAGLAVAPQAARQVKAMLRSVVSDIVTEAQVPGYSVAGKTGTSQIPVASGYDEEGTVASFCGYLPAEDPLVLILVKLDRPETPQGRDAAAPVFRRIAEAAVAALDIPPDQPDTLADARGLP